MKTRTMKKGLVLSILIVLIGASVIPTVVSQDQTASTSARLGTITVDNEGDGDYATITEALANANTGDVIEIYSGLYLEDNLIINKPVQIIGKAEELGSGTDTGKPVVDGQRGSNSVFRLETTGATIAGLEIKGGGGGSQDAGIKLWGNFDNNTIQDNDIHNCTMIGILMNSGANGNIIYKNAFHYNKYGINCGPTAGLNIIYYNSFHRDNGTSTVTSASSTGNTWNRTIGNFWSDYTGVDANGDGIGDTPYEIPGSSNEWDYLPRMWEADTFAPALEVAKPLNTSIYFFNDYFGVRPSNISMPLLLFGDFIFTVNATDYESGMNNVEFYINGEYKADGQLVGSHQYNWTWSERAFGVYNVTVKAFDVIGNEGQMSFSVLRIKFRGS